MNDNSTNTEILIRYMDGELRGKELETVKKNIQENPALLEELENLRFARESARSYGLKNRIRSIHTEMMPELKGKKSPEQRTTGMIFQFAIRVAAVLIVLIGFSAFYQYLTATPEKLFSESYQAFEIHETRGTSQGSLETLYKSENMDSVIHLFAELKSPQAEDYFLAGNAFLSLHKPSEAIESFRALQQVNKEANSHMFEEDAEYYLALSYLANNEPSKALPLFEKIHSDPSHPYNKKVSAWFLIKLGRSVSRN